MVHIIFVRHAESTNNFKKEYSDNNPDLTELGYKQAKIVCQHLKEKLKNRPFKIMTSPLKRAILTAEPLLKHVDQEYEINEMLIEFSFAKKASWKEFTNTIAQVVTRLENHSDDVPIVIFGHSIYLSCLISYIASAKIGFLEKRDLAFRIPNAAITTCTFDKSKSKWKILNVAAIDHLPQEIQSGIEN